jgi:hypothetical protein
MAIFGDSHANHYTPAMAVLAQDMGLSGRQVTVGGCLALLGYDEIISPFAHESHCRALREAMVRFVEQNPRLRFVVLAHRWSIYTGIQVERLSPFYLLGRKGDERSQERSFEVMRESLEETVEFFERKGIAVLLLGEVPPLSTDPIQCLAKAVRDGKPRELCGRSLDEVRHRLDPINALLRALARRHRNTKFFDPLDVMCDQKWCPAVVEGVFMYRDDNHLNRFGSEHLARAIHPPSTGP